MNGGVCGLVDELASGFVTGLTKELTGDGWIKKRWRKASTLRKARNQTVGTV